LIIYFNLDTLPRALGGSNRKNLARAVPFAILAAVFAVPGTAARGDAGSVAWQAPTPQNGSLITGGAGNKVSVSLAASSASGTLVRIEAAGKLPRGARIVSQAGNPARATLVWTPTGRQIGDHVLRFTAVDNSPEKVTLPPLAVTARIGAGVTPLSGVGDESHWAFVLRKAAVRSAPQATAHVKARLSLWTPENYPNLVLALQQRIDRTGTWIKVRLPILPNNSTGWVKRAALGGLRLTHDHFVVDRSATRATLSRNGRVIFTTRVGVGKTYWPTPRGEFYVTEKMWGFHNAAYGPVAFGTSARSAVLTDWPGGGFIGIHGTDAPGLIPGHVSHGCVRIRNDAIVRLARLLRPGTPLTIR
jgi:L,D-transpeptidase catalytic domain